MRARFADIANDRSAAATTRAGPITNAGCGTTLSCALPAVGLAFERLGAGLGFL
jgi:hypothetical protein